MRTLIDVILTLNEVECAMAANDLNAWVWPKKFPKKFKPNDWKKDESSEAKTIYYDILVPFLETRTKNKILDEDWQKRY